MWLLLEGGHQSGGGGACLLVLGEEATVLCTWPRRALAVL